MKQSDFLIRSSLFLLLLSNKLTSIKDSAFTNCESLNGFYIPKSVTKIGNYAVGFMYYGEYVPTINYAVMGEKNSAASAYAKKYEIKFLTQDNLKVSWKRNTTVSGYQIRYSTNKKFKNAKTITVTSNSITSKKLTSVKKGAKYYIRIRGYRSIAGTNYLTFLIYLTQREPVLPIPFIQKIIIFPLACG